MSCTVHVLHVLAADYHKTRKRQWTTAALNAYEDIILQVSKCTVMYSMSDTASISRSTDASDYGVGEYFQTVNGINQTAVFVSKSLTSFDCQLYRR